MNFGGFSGTTSTAPPPALSGGLLIARQPILDRQRRVFAYQLLLETLPSTPTPSGAAASGDTSVADALERCGLQTLTVGRPAFMRMSSSQLQPAVQSVFPPHLLVVEVQASDADAFAECDALRRSGYMVAIDDFMLDDQTEPLVSMADYLKVDFLPSSAEHTRACVKAGTTADASLVAKSVHASEVFDEAVREGFTYFQGHVFEQRRMMRGKSLTALHLASLQILQGLSDPNLSIAQVEHLIKRDAAVAYRILRFANSAAAAQTREVTSMQHALLLVGRDMVRRWASVAILTGLGTESPDELLTMAIVRARFAEILGEAIAGDAGGGEGFLVGLCSLLDVILGRAMADILDDLPLTADVRAALFGRDNHLRRLLDCVIAYERGDWSNCLALAGLAGLAPRSLAPAYLEALRFAYDLKQG